MSAVDLLTRVLERFSNDEIRALLREVEQLSDYAAQGPLSMMPAWIVEQTLEQPHAARPLLTRLESDELLSLCEALDVPTSESDAACIEAILARLQQRFMASYEALCAELQARGLPALRLPRAEIGRLALWDQLTYSTAGHAPKPRSFRERVAAAEGRDMAFELTLHLVESDDDAQLELTVIEPQVVIVVDWPWPGDTSLLAREIDLLSEFLARAYEHEHRHGRIVVLAARDRAATIAGLVNEDESVTALLDTDAGPRGEHPIFEAALAALDAPRAAVPSGPEPAAEGRLPSRFTSVLALVCALDRSAAALVGEAASYRRDRAPRDAGPIELARWLALRVERIGRALDALPTPVLRDACFHLELSSQGRRDKLLARLEDHAHQKIGGKEPVAIARLREQFTRAKLVVPPIPSRFRRALRRRDDWAYSTREFKYGCYFQWLYLRDLPHASPYLLVEHAGHGVNSYALHYYLVTSELSVCVQLAWGGAYMGPDIKAQTNEALALLHGLLPAARRAAHERGGRYRLEVVEGFHYEPSYRWISRRRAPSEEHEPLKSSKCIGASIRMAIEHAFSISPSSHCTRVDDTEIAATDLEVLRGAWDTTREPGAALAAPGPRDALDTVLRVLDAHRSPPGESVQHVSDKPYTFQECPDDTGTLWYGEDPVGILGRDGTTATVLLVVQPPHHPLADASHQAECVTHLEDVMLPPFLARGWTAKRVEAPTASIWCEVRFTSNDPHLLALELAWAAGRPRMLFMQPPYLH